MKFCEVCGNKLEDDTVFCPDCGTNVTLSDDAENQPENFLVNNETAGNDSTMAESDTNTTESSDESMEFQKTPEKLSKKGTMGIFIVVILALIGIVLFAIFELDSSGDKNSANSENTSNVSSTTVAQGDTTGIAHFSVCQIDRGLYYDIKELGELYPDKITDISGLNFIDLTDVPWKNTTATVYGLSSFAASQFLAKQKNQTVGQYTKTICLFNAISYGSSSFLNYRYELAELFVNGKPASIYTYLHDGDEVQAVILLD